MGGGSETIRSAQVIGLSSSYGKLKKKIMLENGKYISSGMSVVVKAKGQFLDGGTVEGWLYANKVVLGDV